MLSLTVGDLAGDNTKALYSHRRNKTLETLLLSLFLPKLSCFFSLHEGPKPSFLFLSGSSLSSLQWGLISSARIDTTT
uniref:Uncharacterized protein n=1 Tax=Nelumbo nucifera TaxID=4432 RepID=A0A822Z398_NELNU|nr:TPA_asm: hypothetical protein HUJ06_013590 [Nelumbo nucifera]